MGGIPLGDQGHRNRPIQRGATTHSDTAAVADHHVLLGVRHSPTRGGRGNLIRPECGVCRNRRLALSIMYVHPYDQSRERASVHLGTCPCTTCSNAE